MSLVLITPKEHNVIIDLRYATTNNFTGKAIYRSAQCLLHEDTLPMLHKAVALAKAMGYQLKIFDAYRPHSAQWALWHHTPDPTYISHPEQGVGTHIRGIAVDLTLIDSEGEELPMGTAFDAFTPLSHHGSLDIAVEAQRNRALLLGIMVAAGWEYYDKEWWHYQLPNAYRYPKIKEEDITL